MSAPIDNYFSSGLCISCGICAGNCPVNCIEMKSDGYFVRPVVDQNACIQCGKCGAVCPNTGLKADDSVKDGLEQYLLGNHLLICCAKAKDKELLKECASGGVVTSLVAKLLHDGLYHSAFLVEGYNYTGRKLATKRYTANESLKETPKSRYLTVDHSEAVRYMLQNRSERIVFVGTPCAISGLRNTISQNRLHPDQYLLIGLFCDKTMHYGVISYFAGYPSAGKRMTDYYFKNKEVGGWPGGVRICYEDGSVQDLPNTERMKVKDYFIPERCLYCLDKLNRSADIAVGDNYIAGNADKEGVSSVIVRTDVGKSAWDYCADKFEIHADSAEALVKSAALAKKKQNFFNGCMKGVYSTRVDVPETAKKTYNGLLEQIEVGKQKKVYPAVQRHIEKQKKKTGKESFGARVLRVLRSLKRRAAEKKRKKKLGRKTFLIYGASFTNKGAQAMLFTSVSELRARFPECRILFHTWKKIPADYQFETVFYDRAKISLLKKNPIYWYPRNLAVLLIRRRNDLKHYFIVRDQFKDIDAVIDVSGFALSSQFSYSISDNYLQMIELAKQYRIPVFLMPQSFGPFNYGEDHPEMIKRIQKTLSYPVRIFAREQQGYLALHRDLGLLNVEKSADLVLQSKSIDLSAVFFDPKRVPVVSVPTTHNVAIIPNIRTIDHGGADQEHLIELYRQIIQELSHSGFHVYLLRHSSEDLSVCQSVYDALDEKEAASLLVDDYDCIAFNEIIRQFDFVIGSRYHSIVHAYKNAVPAVVLGWAEKYRELVSMFGQEQYMFDICNCLPEHVPVILKAVTDMEKSYEAEHQVIQSRLPEYQSGNCFQAITDYFA